jgi:hypothetical protein
VRVRIRTSRRERTGCHRRCLRGVDGRTGGETSAHRSFVPLPHMPSAAPRNLRADTSVSPIIVRRPWIDTLVMAHNRIACSGESPVPAFGALVVSGHCPAGRCASDLFKTTASFRFGWLRLLPGPSLASLRGRLSRHILAPLRYSTVRPLQLANSFTGQVSASVPKGTRHRASERYSFGSHLTYQSGQAIRRLVDAAETVAAAGYRTRILPVHGTDRQLL